MAEVSGVDTTFAAARRSSSRPEPGRRTDVVISSGGADRGVDLGGDLLLVEGQLGSVGGCGGAQVQGAGGGVVPDGIGLPGELDDAARRRGRSRRCVPTALSL